jgi:uncharacterized protein (TIGR02099 family)
MRLPPIPVHIAAPVRLALRVVVWTGIALYFALGFAILALRYFVLPGIETYRGDIEQALTAALRQPVAIRAIEAQWHGLTPGLRIHGLDIRDAEGRPSLSLEDIEADLSWATLWHFEPRFARLEIDAPSLDLRRDAQGRLFVAGLELPQDDGTEGGFSTWLLAQSRVVVRNATVTWHDEFRGAPPLALSRLNFDLRNRGSHHRFGITAEPPRELAARLDIRADLQGYTLEALASWTGEAYAELDYADLAGWRAWVDYPVELPRGSGGVRVWLALAKREVTGVTADLRIKDTAVRLGKGLPMLELVRMEGRLKAQMASGAFTFQAKKLALETDGGIRIAPTDVDIKWLAATGSKAARGEASANGLDLGALAAIAEHLPFEAEVRNQLDIYGPAGVVKGLRFSWTGESDNLKTYSLKAGFEDLGLNATSAMPGFAGFDGRVEANEAGGTLELTSRGAVLDLPTVFEHSKMALAQLDASADWSLGKQGLDLRLRSARFHNGDAAGEASGTYRKRDGNGPGEIDLSAKLTRASGDAVWRYMPLVVNRETRNWLKDSIVGGAATATLRLKGDLEKFPFSDGSGIFEVKGPFHGASLNYAPGWPGFEDVAGTLEFVRERMTIRASKGRLWGVQLADVKAQIADLGAADQELVITGTARGPTGDFLRFIETSPVGDRIDHFTADLETTGNGELNLRLNMPLLRIPDSRVDGRYRFADNSLVFDRDLPRLSDINGELHFTGDALEAKRVRATMLGEPIAVDVATEDGAVAVKATGGMTVAALRKQYGHPVFEHLSGGAPWNGSIRVRKRVAEVRIESSLQGLTSSLPAPFNKTAADTMPFVFERTSASGGDGDQLKVGLGETARAQVVRRAERGKMAVAQGLVSIARPDARMPARGIRLAAQSKRLDVDFWRRLADVSADNGASAPPISDVDLRADEVKAYGRTINGLQLSGVLDGGIWKMNVQSREAAGRVEWTGQGAGRLSARLSRLDIPEGTDNADEDATDSTEELPAIDLVVERFLFHGKEIGELWAEAENTDGVWNIRFDAKNEDGELDGKGRWKPTKPGSPAATNIEFRLSARSLEGLLRRYGYPGMVRRGRGALEGTLSWTGPPTSIDYETLGGKLSLGAENGQFNKLEPGVGRLLSVLSLQSLPRRITLDFRDIFSEGFAFDRIRGQLFVDRGIMRTDDLQIDGPAARVLMSGGVNLANETQDMKVRVQPALGEMLATSVLLINPTMGAAAWLMNKVFGNPLDKVFAFDYEVTGPWADPKVEKVAVQAPAAPAESRR